MNLITIIVILEGPTQTTRLIGGRTGGRANLGWGSSKLLTEENYAIFPQLVYVFISSCLLAPPLEKNLAYKPVSISLFNR